jgi:AcrR family transcriptional regulator
MNTKKNSPAKVAGRPKKVSHQQIVEAALATMEQDGFKNLSLRGLARQLGINHATLYNYVDSIEEVEQDALNELMKRIPLPDRNNPQPLRQQLIEHLLAVRETQLVYPKYCHAPAGTAAWKSHMRCLVRVQQACCDNDEQLEDVTVAYNALIGLIATNAERTRTTGRKVPIQADLEAIAELPRDEFEPLFRPLEQNGKYSLRVSSFVHRLDYLISCLIPHLPSIDEELLNTLQPLVSGAATKLTIKE